ncbi:MAG: diguanylate cyclase, partial [Shimia sp.]|nr:diguanylate cyclase [Shimia sp.]
MSAKLVSSLKSSKGREFLRRRAFPVSIPFLTLAFWACFGEFGLLLAATILPLPFLLTPLHPSSVDHPGEADFDGLTGLLLQTALERRMDAQMAQLSEVGTASSCFSIKIDSFARLRENHGDQTAEEVLRVLANRIRSTLRSRDIVARSGDSAFLVSLDPVPNMNLETAITLANRFQASVEEAIPLQMASIYVTCSIGFCLSSRLNRPSATAMIQGAEMAMSEARLSGTSNVRAYTADMGRKVISRRKTQSEAARTLQKDQIRAWFQPQISTDTGEVTGFEVLARWE